MDPIQTTLDVTERAGKILAKTLFIAFVLSWPLMITLAVVYPLI